MPLFTSTRRQLIAASLSTMGALAASALTAPAAFAQRKSDVPLEDLLKPGALPDLSVGSADAPTTIVEYMSMTCPHCAHFHNTVFPLLTQKYIDTGKVRFIMREFPLDALAASASELTRCAGADKTIPLISVFFAKQESWAFERTNPTVPLFKLAQQAGFTKESFDKCLTDQALFDKIVATRDRGEKDYGVDATPTFFINGRKMAESPTIEGFDKAIAAAAKS